MFNDPRVRILARVYVELQVILEWLKEPPSVYVEKYDLSIELNSNEEYLDIVLGALND